MDSCSDKGKRTAHLDGLEWEGVFASDADLTPSYSLLRADLALDLTCIHGWHCLLPTSCHTALLLHPYRHTFCGSPPPSHGLDLLCVRAMQRPLSPSLPLLWTIACEVCKVRAVKVEECVCVCGALTLFSTPRLPWDRQKGHCITVLCGTFG